MQRDIFPFEKLNQIIFLYKVYFVFFSVLEFKYNLKHLDIWVEWEDLMYDTIWMYFDMAKKILFELNWIENIEKYLHLTFKDDFAYFLLIYNKKKNVLPSDLTP